MYLSPVAYRMRIIPVNRGNFATVSFCPRQEDNYSQENIRQYHNNQSISEFP